MLLQLLQLRPFCMSGEPAQTKEMSQKCHTDLPCRTNDTSPSLDRKRTAESYLYGPLLSTKRAGFVIFEGSGSSYKLALKAVEVATNGKRRCH